MMTDNKSKQDNRERSRVSASEDYEVKYLMAKFETTKNRALELIMKHAGSCKKVEAELSKRQK